jgi:hypothetical protein
VKHFISEKSIEKRYHLDRGILGMWAMVWIPFVSKINSSPHLLSHIPLLHPSIKTHWLPSGLKVNVLIQDLPPKKTKFA